MRLRAVERFHPDTLPRKGIHQILHERNQRRDDNRHAVQHHGRQLVAEGFPAAGCHDSQNIPTGDYVADDLLLIGPECLMVEERFQGFLDILRYAVDCWLSYPVEFIIN